MKSLVNYEALNGELKEQEKLAKLFTVILKTREEILSPPMSDQSTG